MNLLKFITPLNLDREREKFLSSESYNPVFEYYWQSLPVIFNTQGSKLNLVKAIITQDVDLIHKYAKLHFKMDDWLYEDYAKQVLSNQPDLVVISDPEEIKNEFEKGFNLFNLNEYKFIIKDKHGFSFRPNCHNKTLEMSKYATFQFFNVLGEVRHEITHILRYENGIFNNIPRSDYYLATEEGLATYLQDLLVENNHSLYQHCAEYMASKIGMTSSFRDVFDYFVSLGFEKELAWQRTSRHKFGFVDTSLPGDILKPAMYFSQSQNIAKLSDDEIVRLFVGKISLDDLNNHDSYRGRFDKSILESYFFQNE